jgi:hypothetical protein
MQWRPCAVTVRRMAFRLVCNNAAWLSAECILQTITYIYVIIIHIYNVPQRKHEAAWKRSNLVRACRAVKRFGVKRFREAASAGRGTQDHWCPLELCRARQSGSCYNRNVMVSDTTHAWDVFGIAHFLCTSSSSEPHILHNWNKMDLHVVPA